LSGIEQNKNSLISLAEEAMLKLDTSKAFNNDRSLINVTKEFQTFYKDECKNKIGLASDLIIKEENYNKAKKAFEAKKPGDRKQEDVDAYNAAVNDYNKAVNSYNAASTMLNNQRAAMLEKWNKTSQAFLDNHVPRSK
jgi:antitoxin component HigA of HigAB toxin-antitoxin module